MSTISETAVILKGNEENTTTYINLDEEQFNILVDIISSGSADIVSSQNKNSKKIISESTANYEKIYNEIESGNATLISTINEYQSSMSGSSADIYGNIYEMQHIQTFFLSLILGLLVTILFFKGLKK